jgi:hypothetical protein
MRSNVRLGSISNVLSARQPLPLFPRFQTYRCLAANDVEGQQQKIQSARSLPCAPLLLEQQWRAFGRHHLRDVERHRDGGVIAAYADQIDHTPLAEEHKRAVECRVVDVPVAVKLDAELVTAASSSLMADGRVPSASSSATFASRPAFIASG